MWALKDPALNTSLMYAIPEAVVNSQKRWHQDMPRRWLLEWCMKFGKKLWLNSKRMMARPRCATDVVTIIECRLSLLVSSFRCILLIFPDVWNYGAWLTGRGKAMSTRTGGQSYDLEPCPGEKEEVNLISIWFWWVPLIIIQSLGVFSSLTPSWQTHCVIIPFNDLDYCWITTTLRATIWNFFWLVQKPELLKPARTFFQGGWTWSPKYCTQLRVQHFSGSSP